MMVIGLVVLALGAAVGGGGWAAARAVRRNARRQTELVPGRPSPVPDHWFGSHEPEARLYRRVQAALQGIRDGGRDDIGLTETIVAAEDQAYRLAVQLRACAQLPAGHNHALRVELERSVSQFEALAAQVITRGATASIPALAGGLVELGRQLEILEQARAEVESLDRQATGQTDTGATGQAGTAQ